MQSSDSLVKRDFHLGHIFVSFPQCADRLYGTLNHLSNDYHEIQSEPSPAYSTDVKICGTIPPFPHTSSWHGPRLIKRRENISVFRYIFKLRNRKCT
jgi:hypothetical protein